MANYFDFANLTLTEILLRLLAATILGGALGIERQRQGKPLGIRPFVLVAVGSCLAVLASIEFGFVADADETLNMDPAKVIGGILGGIGFLGAGAMFRSEGHVRGAATAAMVWMTGAVGIACAIGYLVPAAFAVSIALLTLLFTRPARMDDPNNKEGG
ncbi:MgtC/SapB family protein [Hyphobacterium sp.]|uniref:MgtC/SapB family protein n=1 Tax=Hyphobacterium sp. TaxID=2004662 RepID=UPI003BABB97E